MSLVDPTTLILERTPLSESKPTDCARPSQRTTTDLDDMKHSRSRYPRAVDPAFTKPCLTTHPPPLTGSAQQSSNIAPADLHAAATTARPRLFQRNRVTALLLILLGAVALFAGVQYTKTRATGSLPPVLLVESNLQQNPAASDHLIAMGFSRSLAMALSRFDGLSVFELPPVSHPEED